jgi:flavin-dependent thymidylate synthase
MEVIIAGYNRTVDGFSPEVISASYARTSRDPRTIPEIREDAKLDVEKARNSNTNIVFGVGHASIAEHVVFNIDIMGVSRFLVEEIESHRLVSYTEKSQRYVLFQNDYVIPKELNNENKKEFIELIEEQNNFYHELYPVLLKYFREKNQERFEREPKTVEGWAKEDARYIISMATKTQLGMTINARNLELMIRRLRACPFQEAHELARLLYEKVYEIAPSLFPYVEPSKMENINKIKQYLEEDKFKGFSDNVFLLNFHEKNKDDEISEVCKDNITILDLLKNMKVYDSAPKEFEVVDFKFNLIISSSCFAQLKRHRMMTIIPKMYNINYAPVIPLSVIETNMEEKFLEIIEKTNKFFRKNINYYCLTNAHCREVFVKLNLREMYHFCRMRMDKHAQWEIRDVANKMCEEAKYLSPVGMSLCCGKDQFEEVYKSIFK